MMVHALIVAFGVGASGGCDVTLFLGICGGTLMEKMLSVSMEPSAGPS